MKDKVLNILKNNPDFISGEEMGNALGISRTAIWKQIQKLKDEGYLITAQNKIGYRLLQAPDRLYPEEIKAHLKTKEIGQVIHYYPSLDSTNIKGKEIANQGFREGTVVITDQQTAGKGRLGRHWYSPGDHGVYMSILIKPEITPMEAAKITLLTGVTVAQAILAETGQKPAIKWPNDVLLKGKKICGILTEMKGDVDRIDHLVVGIGLNVNGQKFPEDIKEQATSLRLGTGKIQNRAKMVAVLLNHWENNYQKFLNYGFSVIRPFWQEYGINIGQDVIVYTLKEKIQGKAIDIDEEGFLLVMDKRGKMHKIIAGDVSLRGQLKTDVN